jgi:hypothetical protein
MSSYTIQLGDYLSELTYEKGSLPLREKIESARKKLFDFDYPIFDYAYKPIFETHFLRNFYTREIGFETEGLFKFYLENWLQINMPYWNKMFESELLVYNPLENSVMDVTHTKKNDSNQTGSSESQNDSTGTTGNSSTSNRSENGFTRQLESNTPDNRLAITTQDGKGVIQYASNIDENSENRSGTTSTDVNGNNSSSQKGNVTASSTTNDIEDFIQHRAGKIGVQTFPKMIQEHRNSLLRVEKMIFDDMNELFMLVY